MTRKTRYFVGGAAAVLIIGLGGGLVAYLSYSRAQALPPGVPPEVRYVPANAEILAFADVKALMNSDLRRELMPKIEEGSRKGKQMMNDFAGVDLEKQVNRVVAYVEPYTTPPDPQVQNRPEIPRALVMVQGTFDSMRIEQFVRERAGALEDYRGRKIFVHREDGESVAVGIVAPDLIAFGQNDLVRRVIDLSADGNRAENVTSNAEMMNVIRDNSGSTAWVVAHFDAVKHRMRLPAEIGSQVPPLRLVSAKAIVNGGVRATVRADAGDEAAAEQLRDVVRGFVSLARLHAGGKSGMESTLKSIELSGSNKTVQLSFAMSPETLRNIAPHRLPNSERPEPNLQPGTPNPEPRIPKPNPAPRAPSREP